MANARRPKMMESPDYLKVTIVPFQVPTSTWVSILMDCIKWLKMMEYIYIYTVTTFKYGEGGPDRQAQEVV
jgi:hypothetical protein